MTTDKAPKPTTRWAILLEAMEKGSPVTLLELDIDDRKAQPPQPPEPKGPQSQ